MPNAGAIRVDPESRKVLFFGEGLGLGLVDELRHRLAACEPRQGVAESNCGCYVMEPGWLDAVSAESSFRSLEQQLLPAASLRSSIGAYPLEGRLMHDFGTVVRYQALGSFEPHLDRIYAARLTSPDCRGERRTVVA